MLNDFDFDPQLQLCTSRKCGGATASKAGVNNMSASNSSGQGLIWPAFVPTPERHIEVVRIGRDAVGFPSRHLPWRALRRLSVHVFTYDIVRRDVPVGVDIAAGAVVIVFAAVGAAAVPAGDPWWRLAVMAAAVGTFAALTADRLAAVAVLVLGWLVMNGFLVDKYGLLEWHGPVDLARLLILAGAAALGLALGRRHRDRSQTKE